MKVHSIGLLTASSLAPHVAHASEQKAHGDLDPSEEHGASDQDDPLIDSSSPQSLHGAALEQGLEQDFRKFRKQLPGDMGHPGLDVVSKYLAATIAEKEGILKLFGKHSGPFFENYVRGKEGHEEAEATLMNAAATFTPLHQAVHDGDVAKLRELLTAASVANGGFNDPITVNVANFWGLTPLHYAAMEGKGDAIRVLRSFGADVNAVADPKAPGPLASATPALLAFKQGGEEAVIAILARTKEGYSEPFHSHATDVFPADTPQEHTAWYTRCGVTALHMAVREVDVRLVEELLEQNPDAVNATTTTPDLGRGLTPMHWALRSWINNPARDNQVLKKILQSLFHGGADVNAATVSVYLSHTPLHYAAFLKNEATRNTATGFLLENGANATVLETPNPYFVGSGSQTVNW